MSSGNLDSITKALTEKGLKVTHQRIVVYQLLMNSSSHPTAEQIFGEIKLKYPSISLATVYKTLETFVENKLINKVSSPQGPMRYDARTDNHNHIYISNTDEILDFEDEELNRLLREYLNKKQFKNLNITDIKLQIRGEKQNLKKDIHII